MKIPVVNRPDYKFYLEEFQGLPFLHIDVYKWSPTIFKRLKKDWNTLTELHGGPIFCCKEIETPSYLKFIAALGFKLFSEQISLKGNIVYIYYWSD